MKQPRSTSYRPRGEVIEDMSFFCWHVFEGGHRCASPALRGETCCYFHHPARRHATAAGQSWNARRDAARLARRTFHVPQPTCRIELQYALVAVVQALAANYVTPGRAGRLIDALVKLRGDLPETLSFAPDPPASHPGDTPNIFSETVARATHA